MLHSANSIPLPPETSDTRSGSDKPLDQVIRSRSYLVEHDPDPERTARLVALDQVAKKHIERANGLLRKGDVTGAVRAFEEAIKVFPSAIRWQEYAEALDAAGRSGDAIEVFRKIVYLDARGDRRDWIDRDGQSLREKVNRSPECLVVAGRSNDADVLMRYALLLIKTAQYAEAWQVYQWGLDSGGFVTSNDRGLVAREERALFTPLLRQLSPPFLANNRRLFEAAVRTAYGHTYPFYGRPDGTNTDDVKIAEYQKAIALQPDYAPAYYCLGRALLYRGKRAEARAAWQKAAELDQGQVKVLAQKALHLFNL